MLLCLFTTSLSTPAFAQSDEESRELIQEIVNAPVNYEGPDREYAHGWFKQIFGEFIFAPWDNDLSTGTATILAKAIGFTNILAIILGIVIIYYVLLAGAMNTASSGEVLGKQWSSVWIPIRTALGFFLVMPMPTIGAGVLSFSQVFIIWIIMLGSNAATVLWNVTLEEIVAGTPSSAPDLRVGVMPAKDIFQMMMCTEYSLRGRTAYKNESERDKAKNRYLVTMTNATGQKKVILSQFYDTEHEAYRFGAPGVGTQINQYNAVTVEFGPSGSCGQISLGKMNESKMSFNTVYGGGPSPIVTSSKTYPDDDSVANYKNNAMKEGYKVTRERTAALIDGLEPLLLKITAIENSPKAINSARVENDESALKALYEQTSNDFYALAERFGADIGQDINTNVSGSQAVMDGMIENMKNGGWAKAGIWFFEIGAVSNMTHLVYADFVAGIKPSNGNSACTYSTGFFNRDICKSINEEFTEGTILVNDIGGSAVTQSEQDGKNIASNLDILKAACSSGQNCSLDTGFFTGEATDKAQWILNLLAEGSNAVSDTSGISNPFKTVTSIGHTMNQIAVAVWGAGMFANGVIEAAKSTKEGISASVVGWLGGGAVIGPATGFLYGTIKWVIMTIAGVLMGLVTVGFVLAYLIPFLPIITWILMMVGYLVTVVEAVIAAPLAIILMVTPEGEGISGTRLERSMQLLAMAILKPSLMIIGLIASITIAGVAFSIMNEFFFTATRHVLQGSVFDFIAIMVVYTTTSLQLCKLLISIMSKLPDQILEWFSSGVGRSFGENEISNVVEQGTGEIKGAVGNTGSSMGKVLASTASKQPRGGASQTTSDDKKA